MKKYLLICVSLFGLLAGCASPTQPLVPTPYPPEYLPTVIALTAVAANVTATEISVSSKSTQSASVTIEPTLTAAPTLTPTPAPTNTATAIPGHDPGAIQFLSPGPMSKLISPIQLRMTVISGLSEKVQVDLYGEDGRLLTRELRKVITSREGVFVSVRLSFETSAVAELGRITVSTVDQDGRIQALNSVRVLLLSSGVNQINPSGNPSEPVGIKNPIAGETVSGGVLHVHGDIWPYSLEPVVLQLFDSDGKSIALRILNLTTLDPQLIDTTLPYKITDPVTARLIVRQDDDRMPGVFYVYSQEVLLNP